MGPPHCTGGPRVPAFGVLYVPEAQGSLPPGPRALYVLGTRASLGRTVRAAHRGAPGAQGGWLSPQVVSGLCAVGALCMLVLSRRTRAFYKTERP